MKRYSNLVYSIVDGINRSRSAGLNSDEIDDLHNDVFMALLEKKLGQFEGRQNCTLATWVRIVTMSTAFNFLKSRQGRSKYLALMTETDDKGDIMETEVADPSDGPEERILGKEYCSRLEALVNNLPAREKLLMKLYYEREYSSTQMAAILQISTGALYTLKNRLVNKARETLSMDMS